MQIWQAIVLGAIQGFTEFLPVSSSGHLILAGRWLGVKESSLFFSVMLHLGTLIPVLIVFWKDIIDLFKKPFNKLGLLILATVPAGIVGLTATKLIDLDSLFGSVSYLLGLAFILTAIELLLLQRLQKRKNLSTPLGVKSSLLMGVGQALAVFPGLSRSGTTLFFGGLSGISRENGARFTFLMSVPIILSAVFLEGVECIKLGQTANTYTVATLFGVITSMVTGYVAIKGMLSVIKKANYKWFSLYLLALGVISFIGGV